MPAGDVEGMAKLDSVKILAFLQISLLKSIPNLHIPIYFGNEGTKDGGSSLTLKSLVVFPGVDDP